MKIKTLLLGNLQTNCYIINDEQNNCLIIDPGANGQKVVKYITENELTVKAILLTHGHFDHIGAVDYLYDYYNCPIYIHNDDLSLLSDSKANLSYYETPFTIKAPINVATDNLQLSNFNIKWLHLPGHCPGASMIYLPDEKIIFSGDVLFNGGIGRFDFPNSSKHDMIQSIQKIKEYDFEATVYPGHGPATSLKHELETNPYLI